MDLFNLAAILSATTGILWVLEAFTLGLRRYSSAIALTGADAGSDAVVQAISEPKWVDWLGKLFLYSLLPLLYLSIRKSMDFSILLSIASAATGIVVMANLVSVGVLRRKLLVMAAERFSSDDPALDAIAQEPIVIESSKSFFPVLLFVLVLRSFIAEPFQIPSGSMKPTLLIGDFIVVNKFAYGLKMPVTGTMLYEMGHPETGDLIVFKPPHEPKKTFIKRVVGLPGDHIRFDYRRKRLWINDVEVSTRYLADESLDGEPVRLFEEQLGEGSHQIYKAYRNTRLSEEWIPETGVVVPPGKYFVMGDNRDNSYDSRYWRFVDEQAVLGKAFAIWLHWPKLSSLPSITRNGVVN
jgi:signal peptidase I